MSASGIVRAAIEILDAEGEDALTFRSLAERLSTGAGAIYHHVANKDELLEAAATELVAAVAATTELLSASDASVRTLTLEVFDLIDAHPWLGSQLVRAPWQAAVMLVFEAVGERLTIADVPQRHQFDVASALVHYVLGAAGQYAASARIPLAIGRSEFLKTVAGDWTSRSGREELPFVHAIAGQLANHDDRQQFAAGVDLILAGAAAIPPT
ncbi:MAG: TetR/AcrR family transcriptional regulator [Dermatophilaceae bacterium]